MRNDENKDRIGLLSRAGTVNSYLQKVENDIYEWNLVSDNVCYQISYDKNDKDEIFMLDPEDGPAIMIGYVLNFQKAYRIRRVKDSNGYAKYLVYFK